MRTDEFFFDLPKHLIAQTPIEKRDDSRLMLLDKISGKIEHKHFYELPELLREGDTLILNDSRVIPARLFGANEKVGAVEILLLTDRGNGVWECLTRPGKKTRTGTVLTFGDGVLTGRVEEEVLGGNRLIRFDYQGIFIEILEKLGKMPLPPYITAELSDAERYQTVYSKIPGSAAAPTAGLHFTDDLLDRIREKGVNVCFITLHVGLGTFRPVKAENIEDHEMHAEYCMISEETAEMVNRTRQQGGRVIAVGTTSCRTLESRSDAAGRLEAYSGWTNIFITPGYQFRCIDGLITNFHLPESTLIMLVSALAGRERVLHAYREAVRWGYRFFSFGDAMLIADQI